jgi:hypothetical protein
MTTTTQKFTYNVFYSDGVTIVDTFEADNLKEAKVLAKERSRTIDYMTAYYSIARVYDRGIRASSGLTYKNF